MLICSERKVLLPDCWWLVYSERKMLLAGWLVADKLNEQGEFMFVLVLPFCCCYRHRRVDGGEFVSGTTS
jgi:hypothetical protein